MINKKKPFEKKGSLKGGFSAYKLAAGARAASRGQIFFVKAVAFPTRNLGFSSVEDRRQGHGVTTVNTAAEFDRDYGIVIDSDVTFAKIAAAKICCSLVDGVIFAELPIFREARTNICTNACRRG